MRLICCLFLVVFYFNNFLAQNKLNSNKALVGTFQLIQNGKLEGALTDIEFEQVRVMVEQQRTDSSITYFNFSPFLKVKVIPRFIINSSNFVPFSDSIYPEE
jgi:hypothetical protein